MVVSIDNSRRTFDVEPHGRKYATVARIDGYWVCTWLSKRRRTAEKKGREFVNFTREPGRLGWATRHR